MKEVLVGNMKYCINCRCYLQEYNICNNKNSATYKLDTTELYCCKYYEESGKNIVPLKTNKYKLSNKINTKAIRNIRSNSFNKKTIDYLANKYNVTSDNIRKIMLGVTWK